MDQIISRLRETLPQKLKEWGVPGLSCAIVRKGQVVYSGHFGYRDMESQIAPNDQTLYAIASTTKAMTATCVGILVDEGKLEWDKPVISYLPEFRMYDEYATQHVTIRDMLCHKTGVPRHDNTWYGDSGKTTKELVEGIRYLKPNKELRTKYEYNNLMFTTCGYIVERVSGMPWQEFMLKRIFEPLDMHRSFCTLGEFTGEDNKALPYVRDEDMPCRVPYLCFDGMAGCGTVNSTTEDMSRWLTMNLAGGIYNGKQIISRESLSEIHLPQILVNQGLNKEIPMKAYGFGWTVRAYRGSKVLDHTGGIDGFSSLVTLMPQEDTGMVILVNRSGFNHHFSIAYAVYDYILGITPIDWEGRINEDEKASRKAGDEANAHIDGMRNVKAAPSHPAEALTGVYVNAAYGQFTIEASGRSDVFLEAAYHGQKLLICHNNNNTFDMAVEDEHRPVRTLLRFEVDISGAISRLWVDLEPSLGEMIPFEPIKKT